MKEKIKSLKLEIFHDLLERVDISEKQTFKLHEELKCFLDKNITPGNMGDKDVKYMASILMKKAMGKMSPVDKAKILTKIVGEFG